MLDLMLRSKTIEIALGGMERPKDLSELLTDVEKPNALGIYLSKCSLDQAMPK